MNPQGILVAAAALTLIGSTLPAETPPKAPHGPELRWLKLRLPRHGNLVTKLPSTWRQAVQQSADGMSPTLVLTPHEGDEFRVVIKSAWSPTKDPEFTKPDAVKRLAEQERDQRLRGAVETNIPLQTLRGTAGTGYHFLVTERATPPGGYPSVLLAFVPVGDVVVTATVMCRSRDTTAIPALLRSLQEARQVYDSKMETLDIESLTRLAKSGNADAQSELARRLGVGEGAKLDAQAAVTWYKAAAEQGLAAAQANLAYMYFNGEGVAKDSAKAAEWAAKAANQGHSMGQHLLGYLNITGTGTARNARTAAKWFLLAAKQGHVESQRCLATMYANGEGVERNPQEADLWLRRVQDAQTYGKIWKDPPDPDP